MSKGPCMCGADDCPRCHPEAFRNGRYLGDEDDESGYDPNDDGVAYIPEHYKDECD